MDVKSDEEVTTSNTEKKSDFDFEHASADRYTDAISKKILKELNQFTYLADSEMETRNVWVDDKVIYRQVMTDYGALPDTGFKAAEFPVAIPVAEIDNIISFQAIMYNGADLYIQNSTTTGNYIQASIDTSDTNLRGATLTGYDATGLTLTSFIVDYTKV